MSSAPLSSVRESSQELDLLCTVMSGADECIWCAQAAYHDVKALLRPGKKALKAVLDHINRRNLHVHMQLSLPSGMV